MELKLACIQIAVVVSAVKVLLIPTYRSTDFEVHRNWLAITHSLPIAKWYTDTTSEWTLDYPPLFAWFEWFLSKAARLADPAMLVLTNLGHDSPATVLFQRGTVIVSDLVLLWAAYLMASDAAAGGAGSAGRSKKPGRGAAAAQAALRGAALFFLLACSAGLLIVDHMHFQYNGVMMGLLLLAVRAASCGSGPAAALLFAALLNAKHLFAYAGPAFFVFLLRHYVAGAASAARCMGRFLALGAVVVAVCGASLGPFLALGQGQQLLRRLFPFGRGLLHAYWAPNAWAPYAAADKALAALLPRLGVSVERTAANMAGGVVGVSRFAVLPQVGPAATAAAVLLSLVPCLAALWRRRRGAGAAAGAGGGKAGGGGAAAPGVCTAVMSFAGAVSYSCLCGFVWGYHVHEKAIIPALLPLAPDALSRPAAARRLLLLTAAGHAGLLPLLPPPEAAIGLLVAAAHWALAWAALSAVHGAGQGQGQGQGPEGGGAAGSGGMREAGGQEGGVEGSKAAAGTRAEQGAGAGRPLLGRAAWAYLAGLAAVLLYTGVVHDALPALRDRLPFLPLLLTSVYCAVGVLAVWADMAVECGRLAWRGG